MDFALQHAIRVVCLATFDLTVKKGMALTRYSRMLWDRLRRPEFRQYLMR